MTRVYVIDPEVQQTTPWPTPGGLRIMEADTVGWASGRIVTVAIYGDTAVPPSRADRMDKRADRQERWLVREEGIGWVAWVKRPQDDDRVRRDTKNHQLELIMAGALILLGGAVGALVLVVLPQCQGGI